MAKQVSLRKGTTAQNNAFTGATAEIVVDTERACLRLHDGQTAGGFEVGSFLYGADINALSAISPPAGKAGIRPLDRPGATFISHTGAALAADGEGFWWFSDAAGKVWRLFGDRLTVTDFGCPTDGVSDCGPAFRSIDSYAAFNGGVHVSGPAVLYNFTSVMTASGLPVVLPYSADNIEISLAKGSHVKAVSLPNNTRFISPMGVSKPGGFALWDSNRFEDAPGYNVQSSIAKNTLDVEILPADAGNVSPGDLIWVRTGQTLENADKTEPLAEMNEVGSVDLSTGVITCRHPFTKPLTSEQVRAGKSHQTSPNGTGASSPFQLHVVTDRTLRNFLFRCDRLEVRSGSASNFTQAINAWWQWNCRYEIGDAIVDRAAVGGRDSRFVRIDMGANRRSVGPRDYIVGPSTGCSSWQVRLRGTDTGSSYLHIHEGCSDMEFDVDYSIVGTTAEEVIAVGFAARYWGIRLRGRLIIFSSVSGGNEGVRAGLDEDDPHNEIIFEGLTIVAPQNRVGIRSDVSVVGLNSVTLTNGDFELRDHVWDDGPASIVPIRFFTATLKASKSTVTLGELPQFGRLIAGLVHVDVLQAFNGDTTNDLIVGTASNDDGVIAPLAVGSTGVKTAVLGSFYGQANFATVGPETIIAKINNGEGSAATLGQLRLLIPYVPAMSRYT